MIAVAAVPVAIPAALDLAAGTSSAAPVAGRIGPGGIDAAHAEDFHEAQVMILVNQQRERNGCPPLRSDAAIAAAAYEHSRDMATNGYFGHAAHADVTPWARMKAAGYDYPGAENIGRGYATAQDVVAGWMGSPGHRANILNCALKAAGVGYFQRAGAPGVGPWWTQDFGYK